MDYVQLDQAIKRGSRGAVPRLVLSLLRDIATGDRGLTAVRHPLGFLCFPAQRVAGYGVCLHMWAPTVERVLTTSEVHAHSWDLTSYVLYGTLCNQRLRVEDAAGQATHRVFEVHSRGEKDELRATGRLVSCRLVAADEYRAADVYVLPAGEFHATVVPGEQDVATVVLSRNHPSGADLALGPVHTCSHTVTRSRCDAVETARAAVVIADRLEAADVR
jgi:hypothetical protein